ncbi:MAG: alpha/beta hydrolase [Pseudomonadota bacterium]
MLSYSEFGPPDAPVILFLHPANFDGRIWRKVIERLPDYRCVAVDLPGHGVSAGRDLTSFEAAADDVAEVIRAFRGPVAIVGLSLGAYVGFQCLVRHPILVDRAVLSGFQSAPIRLGGLARAGMAVSARLMAFRPIRDRMGRAMGVEDPALLSSPDGRAVASVRSSLRAAHLALAFDAGPHLAYATARTLVLAGEREHSAIRRSLPVFQAGLPECTARLVPGLGHAWAAKEPGLLAEIVSAWITDQPLPDRLSVPV